MTHEVKVFSATKARDREALGEKITEYLRANPDLHVKDKDVRQSSDNEFHCVTVILWMAKGKRVRS